MAKELPTLVIGIKGPEQEKEIRGLWNMVGVLQA